MKIRKILTTERYSSGMSAGQLAEFYEHYSISYGSTAHAEIDQDGRIVRLYTECDDDD